MLNSVHWSYITYISLFCDRKTFDELAMFMDFFNLALAGELLGDCSLPDKKLISHICVGMTAELALLPMQRQICSRVPAAFFMKSIVNENLDYSKMKIKALNSCASAATHCYNDFKT